MRSSKNHSEASELAEEVAPNLDVMNLVARSTVSFTDPDCVEIGGGYRRISYVRDMEDQLDPGWGACLIDSKGNPVTTFLCRPSNVAKMRKGIDNSDSVQSLIMANGASASKEEDAAYRKEHGRAKLRLMGRSGESFFDTSIIHQVTSKTKEELEKLDDAVTSSAIGNGLVLESPKPYLEPAYLAASPYLVHHKGFSKMTEYPGIMASTIAASEPFSDSSLDDGHGFMPGRSKAGTACRVAINDTSDDRSNCNIALLGSSGKGKTIFSKMIGDWTTAMGGRYIYVDAELDGARMTKRIGGVSIDVGGGMRLDRAGNIVGSCISPFEPRLGNYDSKAIWAEGEDASDVDASVDVLRATLTFLHGWFSAMWSIDSTMMPFLDNALIYAYKSYGIDFDTTAADLKKNWYPVMQDVQDALYDFEEHENDRGNQARAGVYRQLADYVEQGTERGIYGNLTAYRSNISIAEEQWIHFDVHSLVDMEPNVVSAQMYSILGWIWSQVCVSHATGQFIRVFFDELYLFFGGGFQAAVPLIAGYINMVQKRIRKYNGSLTIATQQLNDLLDPTIKRYGEALLTSSTYKAFFGTDGTDLHLLKETFGLSDAVADRIANFGRGECIFRAGTSQIDLQVIFDRWQQELYNKDKNRGEL